MASTKTFLIDMQGKVVHTWECGHVPGKIAYLLENGNLLRAGQAKKLDFASGGSGGRIQEFTWDGDLVWDYQLHDDNQLQHHDICRMPNGNVLMLVWQKKTTKDFVAAGRKEVPGGVDYVLADSVVEVKPTGKTTGQVVWEWRVWDHLVQDHDKAKPNYDDVRARPERFDANVNQDWLPDSIPFLLRLRKHEALVKRLNAGMPANNAGRNQDLPTWPHLNAVAYNAKLDQIMVSSRTFSEMWIIDHSTTAAEAAGSKGGRSDKGGDLLYRWGHSRAHRAGGAAEQQLFNQHDTHWIPEGLPGEGNLLVFNNGVGRPGGNHSSVDEVVLPVDARGAYAKVGAQQPIWSYTAPKKEEFASFLISGAQRLPNGNTLICQGEDGTLFEVTPEKEVVWKYVNPVGVLAALGDTGGPKEAVNRPRAGNIYPLLLAKFLSLTPKQETAVKDLERKIDKAMAKILTAEQRQRIEDARPGFGPGGFGVVPPPDRLMTPYLQDRLKLTAEQRRDVERLQTKVDQALDDALTGKQTKVYAKVREAIASAKAFGVGEPIPANSVFRAYRYGRDYPGLARLRGK